MASYGSKPYTIWVASTPMSQYHTFAEAKSAAVSRHYDRVYTGAPITVRIFDQDTETWETLWTLGEDD